MEKNHLKPLKKTFCHVKVAKATNEAIGTTPNVIIWKKREKEKVRNQSTALIPRIIRGASRVEEKSWKLIARKIGAAFENVDSFLIKLEYRDA